MTTLSPFRYMQLARYIIRRWIDQAPKLSKGKARATPLYYPHGNTAKLAFASGLAESNSDNRLDPALLNGHGSSGSSSSDPGPSRRNFPPLGPNPDQPKEPTEIYRLMNDERLAEPGAVKPPRDVVVLCHGLYGFSTATPIPLFPSLKLHYWASVLQVLRDTMGVKVLVVGVKGTGSIKERAEQMHAFLKAELPKGSGVNFVAHSMGGLDVRYLISQLKPTTYKPLSLTCIGTPHRGSPFMDWCAANIGVGHPGSPGPSATGAAVAAMAATVSAAESKSLPFSLKSPILTRQQEEAAKQAGGMAGFHSAFSKYLLGIFDSPAYHNLTTSFCRDVLNPECPDDPNVKYTSVAGRTSKLSVFHPLWFPKMIIDAAAEKGYMEDGGRIPYEGNDGLVSVSSAKWGEFLGVVDGTHHWDLRGEGGIWPQGIKAESEPPKSATDAEMKQARKSERHKEEGESQLIVPGGWDWDDTYEEYLGLRDKVSKVASDAFSSSSSSTSKDSKKDNSNGNGNKGEGAWDKAQIGQVVDWITDMLPGGKSTQVGQEQMERLKKANKGASSNNGNGKDKEKEKKKAFDLNRFYGGLMLKLREDGF